MWYTLRVSWIFSPQHTHTHLNHDSRVTPNCWSSNLQPQMTNNDVMRVTYACWNASVPMPISCSLCYVNVDSIWVNLEYIFLHGIPCFLVFFNNICRWTQKKQNHECSNENGNHLDIVLLMEWCNFRGSNVCAKNKMQTVHNRCTQTENHNTRQTSKQNKNINIKYKQTDTDDTELAVNFGSQHFVAVLCNVHYGIRAFFVVVFLCACHALHCCELTVQTISWTGFIDHPTAASRQWLRLHMH